VSVRPSLKKLTHDDYPARSRQKQYSCYTRSLDAETLLAFRDSIRLAPVFIQKRIQKKAEYRFTALPGVMRYNKNRLKKYIKESIFS